MNVSLRKRLFVSLAGCILLAGLIAGALSFYLAFQDANDLQDTQLRQMAALISRGALSDQSPEFFKPRDDEDAETHLVIRALGNGPTGSDPSTDVTLPASLADGLQSLEQSGYRWRVIVATDSAGQRFGVAQRMTVRDEVARDTAVLTLMPLVLLIPVLLIVSALVLKRAFRPVIALSKATDGLGDTRIHPLDEHEVPLEMLPLLQAVNRLMRRLGLTLEQQRRFVSDAAHELRTPLAILTVQADNVLNVDMPAQARGRMSSLREGLSRMQSLVEQLLDFARVQGTVTQAPQPFELNALVRRAIEDNLPTAHAKGIDLGCIQLDPATVSGDQAHAYALVRNAVDNAVRYTPDGGSVDVSLIVAADVACFVVEDTGPGIKPADLERVFEPFFRVLGSQQTGSGLGLSIARTAAEVLGGRIELGARSDNRSGLRFTYRQALAMGREKAA